MRIEYSSLEFVRNVCPHNSQTNHHVWHWSVATTARHQGEPTFLSHAQLLNAFKASRRSSTVQVAQEKAQVQKDHTDTGWRRPVRLRQCRPQIMCHFLVFTTFRKRKNSSFFQTYYSIYCEQNTLHKNCNKNHIMWLKNWDWFFSWVTSKLYFTILGNFLSNDLRILRWITLWKSNNSARVAWHQFFL